MLKPTEVWSNRISLNPCKQLPLIRQTKTSAKPLTEEVILLLVDLQLGFPFRLSRWAKLLTAQLLTVMSPNKPQLTLLVHSTWPDCVHSLLAVHFFFQSGANTSSPVSYLLPAVCFFPFPFLFVAKVILSITLLRKKKQKTKKQSFNCNFRAGSRVKGWCSIPRAVAVRSICHWQDYLGKNICQTHMRTAAENTDSTVSGDVVF